MGPRTGVDVVVGRKIPSSYRDSNLRSSSTTLNSHVIQVHRHLISPKQIILQKLAHKIKYVYSFYLKHFSLWLIFIRFKYKVICIIYYVGTRRYVVVRPRVADEGGGLQM